jgi:hypothetical protein
MRPEYDFTSAVRGKYAKRYAEGTNVVMLDADVASELRDQQEINTALREYLRQRRSAKGA